MAPIQQTTEPSSSGCTKTSEKEELLRARTLRRAERAEARRVEAENHKEAVCSPCPVRRRPKSGGYHRMEETHEYVPGKCLLP